MNKKQFKELRTKTGLSQEAFGELIGRSRWQVMRYEDGSWPIPEHISEWIIPNRIKDFKKLSTSL